MSDSPEIQELTMLRQQLAAMTTERDDRIQSLQSIYTVVGGYDKPVDVAVQNKLAASQARCKQLEEGVKLIALHIEATQLCEINPYDILKTCKELLTPTERPPA